VQTEILHSPNNSNQGSIISPNIHAKDAGSENSVELIEATKMEVDQLEKFMEKIFTCDITKVRRLKHAHEAIKKHALDLIPLKEEYARAKADVINVYDDDSLDSEEEYPFKRQK
jgi:hypothetical protein